MKALLTTSNHNRDVVGLKYVYPVFSRRSGGLSIGINVNTNNACNWQCVYCQVPSLIKGAAPDLDLQLLKDELNYFLDDVLNGDFYRRFNIETKNQAIKDIAISGNGEPTTTPYFPQLISLIGEVAKTLNLFPESRFVLITNGSLIHQEHIREGLMLLQKFGGEVWFKFDSATKVGRAEVNQTAQSLKSCLSNLKISSGLCPTKLQTCAFEYNGHGLLGSEKQTYLETLKLIRATMNVNEVLLYTLARPSMQPEAKLLRPYPFEELNGFAEEIRRLGFSVSVFC